MDNRRKVADNLASVVYGKIPPQATDLEEAVLGALMIDQDAVSSVIDLVHPEIFYDDRHRLVATAIKDLFEKSNGIDLLTVTSKLREMGKLEDAGGPFYITQLTNKVASAAHIEIHIRILLQKHLSREIIKLGSDMVKAAYEDTTDVFELLHQVETNLFAVAGSITKNKETPISSLVIQNMKDMDELSKRTDSFTGTPTGFENLDRVTGGWQNSDLIILAARPSMGKSSLALAFARNAAMEYNFPVAVFSLEMSAKQLVNRLISMESEVDFSKIQKAQCNEYDLIQTHKASNIVANSPIIIDDSAGLNIFELKAKCHRMKVQHGIKLIIIDYLQLIQPASKNKQYTRENELSEISRALKTIAKELNIPIIALSQLSRKVEERGGTKRPMLSDLRESGAIEQDADMVMFLYRAEYYHLDVDEYGNSTKGLAEVIIAKHRNGSLDTIRLNFIDRLTKFVQPAFEYSTQFPVKKETKKRF